MQKIELNYFKIPGINLTSYSLEHMVVGILGW